MTNHTYRLRPIEPEAADALRQRGGPVSVADSKPGYPCRQCLRDAEIGEELILVSYDPFTDNSPYRSAGPIFLHRKSCVAPDELQNLPPQLTGRQLSVRSFDAHAMMIDAVVIDGHDLDATLQRFFGTAESSWIHVHNAGRGCWAVTVDRA